MDISFLFYIFIFIFLFLIQQLIYHHIYVHVWSSQYIPTNSEEEQMNVRLIEILLPHSRLG